MKIKTFILICALVCSASSFEDDYFDENVENHFENSFNDFIMNISYDDDKDLNYLDYDPQLLEEYPELKKLYEETSDLEVAAAKALLKADEL